MTLQPEKKKLSEFSWKRDDFVFFKKEIPQILVEDRKHTYGELISDSEIVDWLIETSKVFRLLAEGQASVYDRLYEGYLEDLEYLSCIGRIEKDQLPWFKDIINLEIEENYGEKDFPN